MLLDSAAPGRAGTRRAPLADAILTIGDKEPPILMPVLFRCFGRTGGGHSFTAREIKTQINAAEDFGADRWILWNPRNEYSAADLKPCMAYAHLRS